jgi:hypothetical protein
MKQKTTRLLKMVTVSKKDVAQKVAKELRTKGCKEVTFRKTKDEKFPYHFYGNPNGVNAKYYRPLD